MTQSINRKAIFLITAAVMLACMPTFASATPISTFDPNLFNTDIAQTANAAATQTALLLPPTFTSTPTFAPTKTPTVTPTPLADLSYLAFSPTASLTATFATSVAGATDYSCLLIAQSPEDNTVLASGAIFSVRWQVKNTGTVTWGANNIDYRYKSGAKLHKQSVYDLYKDIAPGDFADLIADMKAPATAGAYSTVWRIRVGKKEFCSLTLTIDVK